MAHDATDPSDRRTRLRPSGCVLDRTRPTDRVRDMGLLDGKNILVTGVLTDASLAFGVAALAREQGAEVVLTGVGRGLSLTQRVARKLPKPAEVLELDVTVPDHVVAVRDALAEKWGRVDGALHSIGFAPQSCLGDDFMAAPWDDVKVAL